MYNYAVKRLLFGLVTLFAVLTLIFFVVRIVPGDPPALFWATRRRQLRLSLCAHGLGSISH
ncbi:hypothetical protein [Bradyrhizobium arachidis]|uniref:hypothetical protein n=1 Tax=Bradyrhizobium arachidis TaxID=858423 RepID=UPI002867EEAE|nr:hypothetical protein [Bradyrhizobium arachidis]